MEMTIDSNMIVPGTYRARFLGTEEGIEGKHGECIRWDFQTKTNDKYNNYHLNGISGTKPSIKNRAGKFVTALAGGKLPEGSFNTDHFVGKEVLVDVSINERGYPQIDDVRAVS